MGLGTYVQRWLLRLNEQIQTDGRILKGEVNLPLKIMIMESHCFADGLFHLESEGGCWLIDFCSE